MNITDIKSLVNQRAIPKTLQLKVFTKARQLISEEKDVEVVVSTRTITIDVYDSYGMRVDTFSYKIPNTGGLEEGSINSINGVSVCGFS